jgi:hypothetical protein
LLLASFVIRSPFPEYEGDFLTWGLQLWFQKKQ